jgi:hypothetical protein
VEGGSLTATRVLVADNSESGAIAQGYHADHGMACH